VRHLQITLYKIFIQESRHSVALVAEKIGVSPSTLYKWCEGSGGPPSVHQVRQLYFATLEDEILEAVLVDTGLIPVKKVDPGRVTTQDIHRELLDNHDSLSAIHRTLTRALEDDVLSTEEIKKLKRLADVNFKEAAEIRQVFEALE